jgi:hypothetical protein
MKLPSDTASSGSLLQKSTYTRARLAANAKTKKFVSLLDPAHKTLKKAQATLNDAEDDLLMAEAAVDDTGGQLEDAFSALNLDLTAVVKRDYKDPLFKQVFPKGLASVRRLTTTALHEEVSRIAGILKSLPASHPLAKHAKTLLALEAEWKKPLAAFEEAKGAVNLAVGARDQARHDWLNAYDSVFGALRQTFPRRVAFIDGFFRRENQPKAAKKPAPGPVIVPAATGT